VITDPDVVVRLRITNSVVSGSNTLPLGTTNTPIPFMSVPSPPALRAEGQPAPEIVPVKVSKVQVPLPTVRSADGVVVNPAPSGSYGELADALAGSAKARAARTTTKGRTARATSPYNTGIQ
jgi:hypothetical protein